MKAMGVAKKPNFSDGATLLPKAAKGASLASRKRFFFLDKLFSDPEESSFPAKRCVSMRE